MLKFCGTGSWEFGRTPLEISTARANWQQSWSGVQPVSCKFWMPQKLFSSSSNGGQVAVPGGGTVAAPRQAASQPARLSAVQVPAWPAALQAAISLKVCSVPASGVNTVDSCTHPGVSPPGGWVSLPVVWQERAGKNLPQSSGGTTGGGIGICSSQM